MFSTATISFLRQKRSGLLKFGGCAGALGIGLDKVSVVRFSVRRRNEGLVDVKYIVLDWNFLLKTNKMT